jgi:hypothetical protein
MADHANLTQVEVAGMYFVDQSINCVSALEGLGNEAIIMSASCL